MDIQGSLNEDIVKNRKGRTKTLGAKINQEKIQYLISTLYVALINNCRHPRIRRWREYPMTVLSSSRSFSHNNFCRHSFILIVSSPVLDTYSIHTDLFLAMRLSHFHYPSYNTYNRAFYDRKSPSPQPRIKPRKPTSQIKHK